MPNTEGVFLITFLNTSENEYTLPSRKIIGALQQPGETLLARKPEEREVEMKDIPIKDNLNNDERREVYEMIKEYRHLFTNDSTKPKRVKAMKHKIGTNDVLPQFRKPIRIPYAFEEEMNKQVNEMVKNKIIRPSSSPWNAPVMLVRKKDQAMRSVCDFRALNDVTKKDTYPLPLSKDVVNRRGGGGGGSIFWTKLDAASAYWSMPLEERDKEKTAFSVPRGKFEFNVTPYGLCNAGASYQRMIDIMLSGLPSDRVLEYMDDISVYSPTFREHLESLRMVFQKLRETGITLKLAKCQFVCESIDFIGYNISKDGVKPLSTLTETINSFSRPSSKKELKRFLGMIGFYRTLFRILPIEVMC